jgi:hypothetical protein
VTLTAGGNDLLSGDLPSAFLRRLDEIVGRLQPLGARVVVSTVYDPSDGDTALGRRELGLSQLCSGRVFSSSRSPAARASRWSCSRSAGGGAPLLLDEVTPNADAIRHTGAQAGARGLRAPECASWGPFVCAKGGFSKPSRASESDEGSNPSPSA